MIEVAPAIRQRLQETEQRFATLEAQDAAIANELEDLQVAYQREIRGRVGAEYRAALAARTGDYALADAWQDGWDRAVGHAYEKPLDCDRDQAWVQFYQRQQQQQQEELP